MIKKAWGTREHDFPKLSDICRLSTSKEVVEYMLENELIEDKSGQLCGKVHKYPGSAMKKPPCTGQLKVEGPKLENMYFRCNKKGCQHRTGIFEGTMLHKLNIPLPDLFQTLYLVMLNIPVRQYILFCIKLFSITHHVISFTLYSKNTYVPWCVMSQGPWRNCNKLF